MLKKIINRFPTLLNTCFWDTLHMYFYIPTYQEINSFILRQTLIARTLHLQFHELHLGNSLLSLDTSQLLRCLLVCRLGQDLLHHRLGPHHWLLGRRVLGAVVVLLKSKTYIRETVLSFSHDIKHTCAISILEENNSCILLELIHTFYNQEQSKRISWLEPILKLIHTRLGVNKDCEFWIWNWIVDLGH